MTDVLQIIRGDALNSLGQLPDESVQCVVTSPPYWGLRDYGHEFQIGLEKTPEEYVTKLVDIFRDAKRVLRNDGTLWLNLGDSYSGSWARSSNPGGKGNSSSMQVSNNGSYVGECAAMIVPPGCKPKDLVGIPWMVAFALRADGWYLRSDIIWSKPNPMPESVTDRPTKSHEYIFLLSKSQSYYYDHEAIKEPTVTEPSSKASMMFGSANGKMNTSKLAHAADLGHKWEYEAFRNKRSVWTVTTRSFSDAHFATFPPELIKPCILAGAPVGGVVLDPFAGSGTTGKVAIELGRKAILIEPKAEYVEMIERRCKTNMGLPLS